MPVDFILPISISLSLISWTLIFVWYVHPAVKQYPLVSVIQPLLLLHSFRYIGLMFLVPGVTTQILDPRFSYYAAYGDLIASLLAFIALAAIRLNARWALIAVWTFNIWGSLDLLNAVTRGVLYTPDGHFGATFWIPSTIVPLLLVTHGYLFFLLIKHLKCYFFNRPFILE